MTPKTVAATLALAFCTVSGTAHAQLREPEQFYTNGQKMDAWTRNREKQLSFTFWFARKDPDDLIYRQEIVIVYDGEPNKAYYLTKAQDVPWPVGLPNGEVLAPPGEVPTDEEGRHHGGDVPAPRRLASDWRSAPQPGRGRARQTYKSNRAAAHQGVPEFDHSSWDSNYIAPGWNRVRAKDHLQRPRWNVSASRHRRVRDALRCSIYLPRLGRISYHRHVVLERQHRYLSLPDRSGQP